MSDRQSVQLSPELEAWISQTAMATMPEGESDPEVWLIGVRWGCMWIEECKKWIESHGQPASKEAARKAINESLSNSAAQLPGIPRYPSGAPSLRAVMAARNTFILAFPPEERNAIEQLLDRED